MKTGIRGYFLALLAIVVVGGCAGDGCGGCAMEPLPEGGIPTDQTVEGGAQMRVSAAGFNTLTGIVPAVINDTFAEGFCMPASSTNLLVGDAIYCHQNDGMCSPGCEMHFNIDSVEMSVPQDDQLQVRVQFDVLPTPVPVAFDPILLPSIGCTLTASADDILLDMSIGLGINDFTGELEVSLLDVSELDFDLDISGCSFVGAVIDFVVSGMTSMLQVGFIRDLFTPVIEGFLQDMLPDPMGLEGVMDLSSTIAAFSPGTEAAMELRMVPGGYVHLENDGLSLGIITGINADRDPTTRNAEFDSEPALCVPPFEAPDFGAEPALLAKSSRDNFMLNPADVFRGLPESGTDVLLGASETMLDQTGHHIVTSGALCLSVGTEFAPQLNLGAIGLLVPSLAEIGTEAGNDPLLMVTRPTKPVDFAIGDGTEASPAITMHLNEFSIDFYAFLFERYVRGFTVTIDMEIGINLDFDTDVDGNTTIVPIFVGLEAENIAVTVTNKEFLREDTATLEAVFPSLLDMVLPQITEGLGNFALPDIAGFKLDNLSVSKVSTSEDDFLAIAAGLSSTTAMMALGERFPSVALLAAENAPTVGSPTSAHAQVIDVIAPSPASIRAALLGNAHGQLPAVVLDLDKSDAQGRELEWSWNIGGGMWRTLQPGGIVRLQDGAFNLQGRYQLQLRARPVGDYHSWDRDITEVEVVIDSVGPNIVADGVEREGDKLFVPTWDVVFGNEVEVAFGSIGDSAPSTNWSRGELAVAVAEELAVNGELLVFARDPQGNESQETVRISKALVATAGGCSTGGTTGLAGVFLVLLFLVSRFGGLQVPRRWRGGLASLCLVFGMGLAPACNCSSDTVGSDIVSCEINEDCAGVCEAGSVGQCFEDECRCLPDIPYGRIGQYSSMDLADNGSAWIAGYNSTHGDLVVALIEKPGPVPPDAWTFIDGVPDGPVVLPTDVRGGIKAPGDDVGLYTDLEVGKDGTVYISYFDKSSGSLKLAANYGGTWESHVVEAGSLSEDDVSSSSVAGQYSSISLSADGTPAIAYFAHVNAGTAEAATEVRFAQASSSEPHRAADWTVQLVESALLDSKPEVDVLTIPYGIGLFVDLVRNTSDDAPIAAYYDRINGDLKVARYLSETGEFEIETIDSEGDVGWYPSVAVDESDVVHITYVDAYNHDLLYINDVDREIQLVDDGYRLAGTTPEGLPIPEFHFVGDDSALVLTTTGLYIAYQDATTHELLMGYRNEAGVWDHRTVAGNEIPFEGAYGFYANAKFDGNNLMMSSWVVDQATDQVWVELFKENLIID